MSRATMIYDIMTTGSGGGGGAKTAEPGRAAHGATYVQGVGKVRNPSRVTGACGARVLYKNFEMPFEMDTIVSCQVDAAPEFCSENIIYVIELVVSY